MTTPDERWAASVRTIRADPSLYRNILRSTITSMELDGVEVDEERARHLLDEALDGPPLVWPGESFRCPPPAYSGRAS